MFEAIVEFIASLLAHIVTGFLSLVGSGWRKLTRSFRQANKA